MPGRRSTVRLSGGPPWGFRLAEGPGDLAILTIAKVRPKSKAYNILREGDVLLCLNGLSSEDLNYDQAMDIMDSDVCDLTLDISRDDVDDQNCGPAQFVIPKVDKFDAKERSDETLSSEESEEEEIDVPSETKDVSLEAHQGTEPINVEIKPSQVSEQINMDIQAQLPHQIPSDEREKENQGPITKDETSSATADTVYQPEQSESHDVIHETVDHSVNVKPKQEEQEQEKKEDEEEEELKVEEEEEEEEVEDEEEAKEEEIQEDLQTKGRDQVVTLEPINLGGQKHEDQEDHRGTAPEKISILTARDIRSLPTFNTIIRGFSAPQTEQQIPQQQQQQIPPPQQQPIPVVGSRPGFGRAPSDDFVNARNVFQSQSFQQGIGQSSPSILGDGVVRNSKLRQNPSRGGDGDLSSSTQDFSRNIKQFDRSPEIGMGSTGTMFRVKKFSATTKSEMWTPSSGFGTNDYSSSACQTTTESYKNVNGSASPYSTFSKPRPVSMPPGDYHFEPNQTESETGATPMEIQMNGRALSEEKKLSSTQSEHGHDYHRLLKIMQPPPESEQMEFLLSGKKMFSSSSFYEDPLLKYPTVEEQVELCRKIANSLSADTNKLSRGASMYSKRQKRADKWVFEGPDPEDEPNNQQRNYSSSPDSAKHRNGTDDGSGRRKLKLVLDPRQLQDATKLRNSGLYNEHNVISPDICFDLVKDLNSPTGKGAALFAKRKKKSEKWIVDETTVKQHTVTTTETTSSSNYLQDSKANAENRPLSAVDKLIHQQRLKLIKSPWEAALESPIGSCDAAFQEVRTGGRAGQFAETLVKRAEEYKPPPPIIVPPPAAPVTSHPRPFTPTDSWNPPTYETYPGGLGRSTTPTYSRYTAKPDIYKPRAPRGWGGYSTDHLATDTFTQESQERSAQSPQASIWNLDQFTDFNCKARVWGESASSGFRPVRPPSLLFTK